MNELFTYLKRGLKTCSSATTPGTFNFFIHMSGHKKTSTRFEVKSEGGQQCIFDVFLTKPVGDNENLRGREAPEGVKPPTQTNRALNTARSD